MNYKEQTLSGESYTRAKTVIIHNPLEGIITDYTRMLNNKKSIIFIEETIAILGTDTIVLKESNCIKDFDPSGVIPILDTVTNIPTGTSITHAELYTILYSLYIQTAVERDAQQQV